MSKTSGFSGFRPWTQNQDRLTFAKEKLGLSVSEVINEVLDKYLKKHLEEKARKLREALSVPIP